MSATQSSPPLPPEYVREYRGDTLRDVAIAFTVLEILFVGLRFLSRWIGKKPLGLDDWLMGPGLIISIGLNACTIGKMLAARH